MDQPLKHALLLFNLGMGGRGLSNLKIEFILIKSITWVRIK